MKVLPNNFHVYVSVLIGHFGLGISNFCVAWSSPILAKLGSLEDNPLGRVITSLESGVLAALPTTGALFGSYCFGYGSRTWGRRPTMIAIGFPTLLAYPMLAYSTNIWEIYIARILCGISLGGAVLTDTIYFAEISGAKDRAFLGTAMTIFINVAGLLVLIIGTTTSYFVFHVILFVFSPIYLILAFFFLSESPFYLIQKDSRKAEACLKVLRGINSVEKELYDIQYSLENNTEVHLGDIFSKRALRKGLIIGLGLVIFQQLTGGSVISTYCQELFQGVEGGIPSEVVPVIYTIVTFVVSFLAPVFISRFGVKNMLVISTIGMSIALFIFGSYFVAKNTGISVSSLSWVPFIGLLMYGIMSSIGFTPIAQAMLGEIFPLQFKEIITSICATVIYSSACLMVLTYGYVSDAVGLGLLFWIYGGFGVLSIFFCHFFVLETKGKTLNEITEELNK